MEPGFFTSKQFALAAAAAFVVLAVGALAVGSTELGFHRQSGGCRDRVAVGEALNATFEDATVSDRRTMRWTFNATSFPEGGIDLCLTHGEIIVEPTQTDTLAVEVRVTGSSDAREAFEMNVALADDDGRLRLAAWESIWETSGLVEVSRPSPIMIVQLPEDIVYGGRVVSSFGDIRVGALRMADLDLDTPNGDLRASGMLLEGNLTAQTRFGDVALDLASVQNGTIVAGSSGGDVEVRVPLRADVGYDVVAEASAGEVAVRIGDAETYDSNSRGFGGETHVRSAGYATKPTQVRIDATTRFGDVSVVAS